MFVPYRRVDADLIFLFDENAGQQRLVIKGENHKYLFKVRRHALGDEIDFRHPGHSETLYGYRVASLEGRQAVLELQRSGIAEVKAEKPLHIGWCIIDAKSVEKVLPSLNEIGVEAISFIHCDRSQKNFKPDFKRYERILQSSMQQCGRSAMMRFETVASVEAFVAAHPDCLVFDFCDTPYDGTQKASTVLIGAEGGFSDAERKLLEKQVTRRLDTAMVLRSETAAVAISSKMLLG